MVSFNQIPINLLTPGQFVEFDNSKANKGTPAQAKRTLLFVQRLTGGTVPALTPVLVPDGDSARAFFGAGSYGWAMCAAYKAANKNTPLWAVALDDIAGGTVATGTCTFTGSPTVNGTIFCYIAGVRVTAGITSGMTPTQAAAALVAAINAVTDLPVTAANVAGVVTTTARHKGTLGNGIDLRLNYQEGEATPAGLTVAIAAMSGGATDPDVNTALAAIGATWYNTFATAFADTTNLGKVEAELLNRWGPDDQNDGQCFAAVAGTLSAMTTFGTARNSPFSNVMGTGKSPTAPWVWSAALAGVDDSEPDPARQRTNLPIPGVLPPAQPDRLKRSERNLLLTDGISTFIVDSGGNCIVERLVTTYQLNTQGLPDPSYRDHTTMILLGYLRYSVRVRFSNKFPRHKLASDGTNFAPGQLVVTPAILTLELIALAREWEQAALIENVDQFVEGLIVERDANDPNRANAVLPPDLINQLLVFAAQIQFRL